MESLTVGVTGAAGYIGSRVTKLLLDEGHDVIPVDNFFRSQVKEIENHSIEELDIRDREDLESKFSDVDIIMHLAAVSGVEDCSENQDLAFETNINGTSNVAYICRKHEIPLIFPMSVAAIGDPKEFPITSENERDPLNWYGKTKVVNEEIIRSLAEDSFPAHIYMKSNLYGKHILNGKEVSKQVVINYFISCAEKEEPLTVYKPGTQARDFIHVKDVAKAYLNSMKTLLNQDVNGAKTVTMGSGRSISVMEIAEKVQKIYSEEKGFEPEIKLVDNPREAETVEDNFKVDVSDIEEEIGFRPEIKLEEGIRSLIK